MGGKKSYHHKDLYRELLEKAFALVAEVGYDKLSLRELASSVGVTVGAIYHHFPSRQHLLVAVAVKGFDELNGEAERIGSDQKFEPMDKLFRMTEIFLAFARKRPQLFRLMYESEIAVPEPPQELIAAQKKGYDALYEIMQAVFPGESVRQLKIRMVAHWSALYGYAHLNDMHLLQPYMTRGIPAKELVNVITRAAVDLAL